jgi:hypothetical protein
MGIGESTRGSIERADGWLSPSFRLIARDIGPALRSLGILSPQLVCDGNSSQDFISVQNLPRWLLSWARRRTTSLPRFLVD